MVFRLFFRCRVYGSRSLHVQDVEELLVNLRKIAFFLSPASCLKPKIKNMVAKKWYYIVGAR